MNCGFRQIVWHVLCAGFVGLNLTCAIDATDGLRARVLREAAVANGLCLPYEINADFDNPKAKVGEMLFSSKFLSLNDSISCQSCHLPQFSSVDGLPNAIGARGQGHGLERQQSGGAIVPRNTLPLWGRGAVGFNTFFWDGKVQVDNVTQRLSSQFGSNAPSNDPLVVAIHLPFVEFREMIDDEQVDVAAYKRETVDAAWEILSELLRRVNRILT